MRVAVPFDQRSKQGLIDRLVSIMAAATEVQSTSRRQAPTLEVLSRSELDPLPDHELRGLYDAMCAWTVRNTNAVSVAASGTSLHVCVGRPLGFLGRLRSY